MYSLKYKDIVKILLFLVFGFSVFIDMYNGYSQYYLNTQPILPSIYKGIILLCSIIVSLKGRIENSFKLVLLIIFIYIIHNLYWACDVASYDMKDELNFFVKISFPYFILAFMLKFKCFIDFNKSMHIVTSYGIIAATSIIVSFFLGIGINSYGEIDSAFGFGTKGFFTAGNDIGVVLLMTNCILSYLYVNTHKYLYLLEILVVASGTLMIGSMTGIIGSLIIVGLIFMYIVFFPRNGFSIRQRVYLLLMGLISCGFLLYNIILIFISDAYMQSRLDKFLLGESRSSLDLAATNSFNEFSVFNWIFGKGYTGFASDVAYNMSVSGYRLTEMDFHDVIGFYGIFLGLGLIGFSFFILLKLIKFYRRQRNPLFFWSAIAILIYMGHGFFAGHAYTSPQSSLMYIFVVFIALCHDKTGISKTNINLHYCPKTL